MLERFEQTRTRGADVFEAYAIPFEAINAIAAQNPYTDLQVNADVLPSHLVVKFGTGTDGITRPIFYGGLIDQETGNVVVLDDPVNPGDAASSVIMDRVIEVTGKPPIKIGR